MVAIRQHSARWSRSQPPAERPFQWRVILQEIRQQRRIWRHADDAAIRQAAADLIARGLRHSSPYGATDIVPAAALVTEVIFRQVGQELFDSQIQAGIALHFGRVVEMGGGEGKTLAAAYAACLHALRGTRVIVGTAAPWLAARDGHQLRPVFAALGLPCSVTTPEQALSRRNRSAVAYIALDAHQQPILPSAPTRRERHAQVVILDDCDPLPLDDVRVFHAGLPAISSVRLTSCATAADALGLNGRLTRPTPQWPAHRTTRPMRAFATRCTKWNALVSAAVSRSRTGQPVLIGTWSCNDSLILAEQLRGERVTVDVLFGDQDRRQAERLARAGEPGRITIVTNLAGRGTDIPLTSRSLERGGLCVLLSEAHWQSSLDRRLIGLGGRRGAPAEAQTFVSAEDRLLTEHADWLARSILRSADADGESAINPARGIQAVQRTLQQTFQTPGRSFRKDAAHVLGMSRRPC